MSGYLIYHPCRAVATFDGLTVYHDHIGGNQDPYIWNNQFLHTYCHITQMTPNVGDINFWVSGDTFPNFSYLYCDLVFVVAEKLYWENANIMNRDCDIVDSEEAYIDHYIWAASEHPFKNSRRRYTLKADPERSFQPQHPNGQLIDILPFLIKQGLVLEEVRQGMRAGYNSKPLRLEFYGLSLYNWLQKDAPTKLYGSQLRMLRQKKPQLASILKTTNCSGC